MIDRPSFFVNKSHLFQTNPQSKLWAQLAELVPLLISALERKGGVCFIIIANRPLWHHCARQRNKNTHGQQYAHMFTHSFSKWHSSSTPALSIPRFLLISQSCLKADSCSSLVCLFIKAVLCWVQIHTSNSTFNILKPHGYGNSPSNFGNEGGDLTVNLLSKLNYVSLHMI